VRIVGSSRLYHNLNRRWFLQLCIGRMREYKTAQHGTKKRDSPHV
jgi:hypothetical protein